MNNIKFRGFSLKKNKWIYGDLIRIKDDVTLIVNIDSKDLEDDQTFKSYIPINNDWIVDPKSIGQWTTLLDKEGKEIYSSDIVVTFNISTKGKVYKFPPRLITFGSLSNMYVGFNLNTFSKYLVIGNAFENPELIK